MISLDRTNDKLELARQYTQFKSDKIKEYKDNFPSMAIKHITKLIVKDWNTYTLEQQRNYMHQMKDNLDMSLIVKPTPNKMDNQNEMGSTNSKKKSAKTPQEEIQINTPAQFEQNDEKSMKKTKIIGKNSKSDYITFYKHHYSKYSEEHPRWSSQQISVIIKLLWKNRTSMRKINKINFSALKDTKTKKMSPMVAFMQSNPNNRAAWRRLPLQSKRLWQKKDEKMMDQEQIVRLPNRIKGLQFMNSK